MNDPRAGLSDKKYLGDGVYVGHDGYHLVLWLDHTGAYGRDAIALDPQVLKRLDLYREELQKTETTKEPEEGFRYPEPKEHLLLDGKPVEVDEEEGGES